MGLGLGAGARAGEAHGTVAGDAQKEATESILWRLQPYVEEAATLRRLH